MGNGYVRTAPESEKIYAPPLIYGGDDPLDQIIAQGGVPESPDLILSIELTE